jgi:hypothetical protein
MTEKHIYIDNDGLEWKRVWTPANFSIDGTINPWSEKQFKETAESKNYTLGEMWDRSAEMSAARAEKEGGVDPVKKQWEKDYSKKRKGAKYTKDGSSLMGGGDAPSVEFTD